MIDVIKKIESWYQQQCNSNWEHQYGVSIDTLDNPGWSVKINLLETSYSDLRLDRFFCERSDSDWIDCKIESGIFCGCGGPMNLGEILDFFLKICESHIR